MTEQPISPNETQEQGFTTGADVVTADDQRIGAVKETEAGHFKVDVRWARDYWLDSMLVREWDEGRVVLSVRKDLLAGHKLRRTARGFEPMVRMGTEV